MAMSALFYILGLIVVVTGLASIATLVGVAQLYVTGAAVLALAIGVMLAITRSRGSVA
jgi:hypothetical protein